MLMSTAGNLTRTGKCGFTLFELVVVIAILAITVGLLVPNLDIGVGENGVESAVKSVQTAVNRGRSLARLTRTDVSLEFNESAIVIGPDKDAIPYPGGVVFGGLVRPDEDSLKEIRLVVDRRGIVPVSIVLIKVDDQTYSLLINPIVRQVEYKKGIADFEDFSD